MLIPSQRSLFDIPDDIAYLNASYMTPATIKGADIVAQAGQQRLHPWQVKPIDFFERSERVRLKAARVMGAQDADGIALHPAVSYSVATVARNLGDLTGKTILTIGDDFPSMHYGWQTAARDSGAAFAVIDGPPEHDWTAAILARLRELGDRCALVAIPQVHWSMGRALDLAAIRQASRDCGAMLFLDLTQSLGAMPFSVAEIDPDFVTAAGYKWLFGAYGVTYFYAAQEHRDGQPLEQNWITREGAQDFSRLTDYTDQYKPGARRFDMGERSNFLNLPLSEYGLDLVLDWGVDNIAETLAVLNQRLAHMAVEAGWHAPTDGSCGPHLRGLQHGELSARAAADRLREFGVVSSVRGQWVRISPHLWLNDQDFELIKSALTC